MRLRYWNGYKTRHRGPHPRWRVIVCGVTLLRRAAPERGYGSERDSRKGDVLTYEATVEDPVMFSKPWVIAPRHFRINNNPHDQMLESVCFDADGGHIVGGRGKN